MFNPRAAVGNGSRFSHFSGNSMSKSLDEQMFYMI